ncbi:DNA repair protein rad52 [Coemansia sp. RSA 552]|nr:DNA repair protein rad52 [Coemansia sp. RSA 552]
MAKYSPSQATTAADAHTGAAFTAEESERMQFQLRKKLGPEHISTRQGMGGSRLSYIEGWRIISIANEVFGFDGWRSSIQNLNIDFMDVSDGGRLSVGASCVMRITLRDGTYREDVGFGMIENVKSKGQALEKVRKEATTDALKRAMRQFGNVLGNCVYDKEYVRNLTRVQKQPRGNITGDALYRYSDLESSKNQSAQAAAADGGHDNNGATAAGVVTPNGNQFQRASAMNPAAAAGNGGRQGNADDDGMEFDLDAMDDAGVLDMLEDLESNRPILYDGSPTFAATRQNAHQMTPMRAPGSATSMEMSDAASLSAGSAGGTGSKRRIADPARRMPDGTPTAARNLSFHPPPPPHQNQPANTASSRPRSFADVSSFVPSSTSATGPPPKKNHMA